MFNKKNKKIERLLIENADLTKEAELMKIRNAETEQKLKQNVELCHTLFAQVNLLTRKRNEKGQFV